MRCHMTVKLSRLGTKLLGKTAGRKHYGQICGMLTNGKPGEISFLDFEEIEIVNASWLNMAIAPVYRWCADSQNELFPVITHFPSDWIDELDLVAQVNGQCYALVESCTEPVEKLTLVGPLEESLRGTLRSLLRLRAATGAQLARSAPDAGILATAWNNRLKELYDMRLLTRHREGRQQIYRPLAEKVEFHG